MAGVVKHRLFVYATLKSPKTQRLAMGHKVPESTAIVSGWQEAFLERKGEHWPTLIPTPSKVTRGDILAVTDDELKELDNWENHYKRLRIMTSAGPAYIYLFRSQHDA